jgi:hypothetical protein
MITFNLRTFAFGIWRQSIPSTINNINKGAFHPLSRSIAFILAAFCVAELRADDPEFFQLELLQGEKFEQTGDTAIAPVALNAFFFQAIASPLLFSQISGNPVLRTPLSQAVPVPLSLSPSGDAFTVEEAAASSEALAASYPAGAYFFNYTSKSSGAKSLSFALPAGNIPGAVLVSNFAALQKVDPAADLTITWPRIAGASDSDQVELNIFDSDGNLVVGSGQAGGFDARPGTTTSYLIDGGTLDSGQTYKGVLGFYKIVVQNQTTLPLQFAAYYSQTQFTIKTSGPVPGTDTTPPALQEVSPPDGIVLTNLYDFAIAFSFSESMKPAHAIQWSTNIDPAKVSYQWFPSGGSSNSVLVCRYPGAWPHPGTISWMLNPSATDTNAFRDSADLLLPVKSYSGSIKLVPPDLVNACDGADLFASAGFGVIKTAFYGQDSSGGPFLDAENRGEIRAWIHTGTFSANRVALINPAQISNLLTITNDLADTQSFNQSASTLGELDVLFSPGVYLFQRTADSVTSTAQMRVGGPPYPPIPHILNLPMASNASADLEIRWQPSTNAGEISVPNQLTVLEVFDMDGRLLLRAPDACQKRILSPDATSFTVPAGTLNDKTNYVVALSFLNFTDQSKSLPGVSGPGIAAVRSTTRVALKASPGSTIPPNANHLTFTAAADGQLHLDLVPVPGARYVLEAAGDLVPPVFWVPVETNDPSSTVISFSLPANPDFAGRFFRVRLLDSTVPLSATKDLATVDLDRSAAAEIDSEGGILKMMGASGTLYQLEVPYGGLITPETIRLTEIKSLQSFPFGAPPIASVLIEPADRELEIAATLTIIPNASFPEAPLGFGYNSKTGEFFLNPSTGANGSFTLPVNHLGAFGLVRAISADLAHFQTNAAPTDFFDDLSQSAVLAATENGSVSIQSTGSLHALQKPRSTRLANAFNNSVYPLLVQAQGNTDLAGPALQTYLGWWESVGAAYQLDRFAAEISQANPAAIAVIRARLAYLEPRCRAHDYDGLMRLHVLKNAMTVLPWSIAYAPGEEPILLEKIRKLLRFRLQMESDILGNYSEGPIHAKVESSFAFYWGDQTLAGEIKGAGPLEWTAREHFTPPAPCTISLEPPDEGNLSVLRLGFYTDRPSSTNDIFRMRDVYLEAWPDFLNDGFVLECDGISASPYFWFPEFGVLHENELGTYKVPGKVERLSYHLSQEWAMEPSGSEVMARKTYNRDKALNNLTLHEYTRLTLHHFPEP